ncbi:MAG: FadR family transcriptional regulator [Chloroflexi bacterium]|nr:FadR family transcriptional regulator [Chloroflexota bacterium]
MDIKRKSQKPVYNAVVEHVTNLIKQGDLQPGDPLLSERELCERFNVSRTSVRKALAILSGMGLVEVTPRSGARVAQANSQPAIDSLSQMIARNRYQAVHLYEVRRLIEVQAARLAAIRRDEADVIKLRELHNLIKDSLQNPEVLHQADMRLHIGIAESAKNPFFGELMSVLISAYMEIFNVVWAPWGSPEEEQALFAHYFQQHSLIVEAIADKDPEAAATYMTQHVDDSRKQYERMLAARSKA